MRTISRARRRRGAVMRGLILALAVAAPAVPDTVTLRNGEVIKCKVIKETKELVKVRMPHRGKIVTTFLSRGAIDSISKLSDAENRLYFQERGVRNPAKSFEPIYYNGGRTASTGKPGAARGKGTVKGKERGVEARRKAAEERAKAREKASKYGDKSASSSSASSSGSSGSASPVVPVSPVTTGGAATTASSSFGSRTGGTSLSTTQ